MNLLQISRKKVEKKNKIKEHEEQLNKALLKRKIKLRKLI